MPSCYNFFLEVWEGENVTHTGQTAPGLPTKTPPDTPWPVSYTHLDVYKRQA